MAHLTDESPTTNSTSSLAASLSASAKRATSPRTCWVIIAGSRTIRPTIKEIDRIVWRSEFNPTGIISGGAKRGVDPMGEAWARSVGLPVRVFEADWETHGARAGMLRNALMLTQAHCVIAIWDGSSRGTRDMIRRARHAGVPTITEILKP